MIIPRVVKQQGLFPSCRPILSGSIAYITSRVPGLESPAGTAVKTRTDMEINVAGTSKPQQICHINMFGNNKKIPTNFDLYIDSRYRCAPAVLTIYMLALTLFNWGTKPTTNNQQPTTNIEATQSRAWRCRAAPLSPRNLFSVTYLVVYYGATLKPPQRCSESNHS